VQTELNVSGMHCANCAISIHKYLENNGAKDIYVDFASDEVKFSEIPLEQIPVLVKGIESLGYKVISGKDKKPSFWKSIDFKFLCCQVFCCTTVCAGQQVGLCRWCRRALYFRGFVKSLMSDCCCCCVTVVIGPTLVPRPGRIVMIF
jgi:copper chaperone CopZ